MQTSQGLWQTFIITGQPTKTSHPGEGALHDPASGQQDKALLGFGQFNDFQVNAMLSSSLFGLGSGIALVDKGDFNAVTRNFLNLLSQQAHLSALLLVGWGDMQRQQQSQR